MKEIKGHLIDACIKGERRAQFELYDRCFSELMSVCRRYRSDKDDVNDLLNTGFYKVLKGLHTYGGNVPFKAWIRKIMINSIIDMYRREKRRPEIVELNIQSEKNVSYNIDINSCDEMFDAEELELMITKLPDRSRQVFNLFAIDGYGHKEIAKMMNITIGTSKWHLANARKLLQQMIRQVQNISKVSGG